MAAPVAGLGVPMMPSFEDDDLFSRVGREPTGAPEDCHDDARSASASASQAGAASRDNGYESESAGHGNQADADEDTPMSADDVIAQKLRCVPGWSPEIMGKDISPHPPLWPVDPDSPHGDWTLYLTRGPDALFPPEQTTPPRWLRFEQVIVLKKYIQPDARFIGDFETLNDPEEHRSQCACAKMLGMLTVGTAKGIVTGSPSELVGKDKETKARIEKDLRDHGMTQGYTFCVDEQKPMDVAPQFTWFFEWLYDEENENEQIGFRITKAIADPTHSSDELWQQSMNEHASISKAGQANGMPEARRSAKMLAANKLHRQQVDVNNLESCAEMMCKLVQNGHDLAIMYRDYGGSSSNCRGSPLYPDTRKDVPDGCDGDRLPVHPRWGGSHALGPSVAINALRMLKGSNNPEDAYFTGEDPYYCNVATAGLTCGQTRYRIHPSQREWKNYIDPETGSIKLPEWVEEKNRKEGCFFACHKGEVCNIFRAGFPTKVTVTMPDDSILKMLYENDKDKPNNPISLYISKMTNATPTFEKLRKQTCDHFERILVRGRSAASASVQHAINNKLLTADTLDLTPAELQRINIRNYGESDSSNSNRWVFEPKQVLKDISVEIRRMKEIADEWNKRQIVKIADEPDEDEQDRLDAERDEKFSAAVEACIKMGLERFEHSYLSKRKCETIPEGWRVIAHEGLRDALRLAVELSAKHAELKKLPRRFVEMAEGSDAGCANMAFLYNRSLVSRDTSPFGTWRTFLFTLFSRCASISGPDIRLMLELWTHAFEGYTVNPSTPPIHFTKVSLPICSAQVSGGVLLFFTVRRRW